MDRKAILVLVICFLLLMFSRPLVERIYPPVPAPARTNITTAPTSIEGPAADRPADDRAEPSISAPASPTEGWLRPATPEQELAIDTDDARYLFTSHGGGLKSVELKDYRATITCGRQADTNEIAYATLNQHTDVPSLALFGGPLLEDSLPFSLRQDGEAVVAEKVLTNGLSVVKTFQTSTNHQLQVTLRIENRTNALMTLPSLELVVGTASPMQKNEEERFLGLQFYDGNKARFISQSWFANRFMGCGPSSPRLAYRSEGVSNIVWAAVQNRFFTMIAAPETPAYQVVARKTVLDWPELEENGGRARSGYRAALVHPGAVLEPGGAFEWKLTLFAGPKEYNTLVRLGHNQDLAMNFTSFFGWFAKALLLSMNGLHRLGLSYGLTIIAITVIIKLLFWPLTQASTRSMKRMQALQPQMKALQEKYKDDPRKMNMKLMEFMKENRVSPLGGCLPILLQIPVFIGFYQMLQSSIELRGARFLWACDLSQPDTIAMIFGFPLNPLPLIMGASQFWQTRMMPPSPGMDPVQQKIMQYMPLIFIFILYNFPAGLALYWTVQNLLSILQMKLTKTASATTTPGGPAGPPAAVAKAARKSIRKPRN